MCLILACKDKPSLYLLELANKLNPYGIGIAVNAGNYISILQNLKCADVYDICMANTPPFLIEYCCITCVENGKINYPYRILPNLCFSCYGMDECLNQKIVELIKEFNINNITVDTVKLFTLINKLNNNITFTVFKDDDIYLVGNFKEVERNIFASNDFFLEPIFKKFNPTKEV